MQERTLHPAFQEVPQHSIQDSQELSELSRTLLQSVELSK